MEYLHAILLGIVQGLTEFLPVSSSGHLELVKAVLGNNVMPEESMFMTVLLHGATALSTVVVFRSDIKEIITGLFQFKWNDAAKFSLFIVLSMIPAAVVGVLFNDEIEQLFSQQILLVGLMLIFTGILLFVADRAKDTGKSVTRLSAAVIGVSQAIAIVPGISRSGATIATAVIFGIDKVKAARFSFLMVVPLIFGKIAKDLLDGGALAVNSADIGIYTVGFIAAFITGLLACTWMIQLVRKSKLVYFSWYCFVVGIVAVIWALI